ncbi:MAG: hypothetical protein KHZ90_09665 [Veillonella parvula]|uniref:Uncharacterized protein n=1 Tax=Veillonella parvula TaxID=29466 RepID=A0A942WT71_VEIPA|nr:hypothetical protein [Veillonella parvula]MBS4894022.1 hypothetical protein [Veillonella parvula]
MINKREWKEFKDSGLLWWINTLLHTLGWAIIFEYDEKGNITEVYPARVKFRGFDERTNESGYKSISKFIKENANELFKESNL